MGTRRGGTANRPFIHPGCGRLTGYSEDFIRAAIHSGKLKAARGRRRGYDIKRADLEAWVKKL
jgi:excisionase family DNA binding protein